MFFLNVRQIKYGVNDVKNVRKKEIQNVSIFVLTYMVTLKNKRVTSISREKLSLFLNSVGIRNSDEVVCLLIKKEILIPLQNNKLTMNFFKAKKML